MKVPTVERQGGVVNRLDWLRDAVAAETDDCIEWPYANDGQGYGRIQIDGQRHMATHVALEMSGRPRPDVANHYDGSCALHSCDNPPCCNPRHLRWGTQAENMTDRQERGRFAVGSAHKRAKFTEADVREMRRMFSQGFTNQEIAEQFGTSYQNVHQIVQRRTWRHVA